MLVTAILFLCPASALLILLSTVWLVIVSCSLSLSTSTNISLKLKLLAADEPPSDLKGPSEEEVAALEANTPIRSYVVTIMEPTLVLHAAQHVQINMKTILNAKRRKVGMWSVRVDKIND